MSSLFFSNDRKSLSTYVYMLTMVLVFGISTLGKTPILYAQAVGDSLPIQETQQADFSQQPTSENTATDGTSGAPTANTPDATTSQTEPAETTETTTLLQTGDADSSLTSNTTVNTNDSTLDIPQGSTTTVTNENTAEASTTASVEAVTGENSAQGEDVYIQTGNATGNANVLNVVNTNIFNSTGLLYFINMLLGNISLDVRDLFSILTGNTPSSSGCSLDGNCTGNDTTVLIQNNNDATIQNDIAVLANTGGNTVNATGNASISTGNAYASANVVNVVNTNITNSTYLLLTVNNFNPGSSSIIFPGANWFTDLLSAQSYTPGTGTQTTVTNINDATITSSVELGAITGTNSATGTGTYIETGDAATGATVVNKVNQNYIGPSISLLFKIHGNWTGEILGLPQGLQWRDTGDGIEIYLDGAEEGSGFTSSPGNLSVSNTNTATVKNNVSVYALTGDNEMVAPDGGATIDTGDAQASANIVNLVNTNILGRNWVLAIFNIFGDWTGNINFGLPDLWVGARALQASRLHSGSCFTYEVTISNLSDVDAHNVTLEGLYDKTQQTISTFSKDLTNGIQVQVGTVDAQESIVRTLNTCIAKGIQGGTSISTEFSVRGSEEDANTSNNSDMISVSTALVGGGSLRVGPAKLSIDKTVDRTVIHASSSVTYKITIMNEGDPVYNALLVDTIYNEMGDPIHEQRWGLDTIQKNETIIVSYEAFFEGSTSPGVYTNKAFISGTEHNPNYERNLGSPVDSPVAQVQITVVDAAEEVPQTCSPLLTTYIRYGAVNDPAEVGRLQFFLRTMEGYDLVEVTNTYNETTYQAVRDFQTRYANTILDPWGMTTPSGYVYITTQKQINELWCTDIDFSLSDAQKKEIENFKDRTRNYIERSIDVPSDEFERFGLVTPQENETLIALDETQPAIVQKSTDIVNSNQVAAVANIPPLGVLQSFWSTIRKGFTHQFSWLPF